MSLKLIEFLTHHAYGICCNMMRELDCHFKFLSFIKFNFSNFKCV